MIKVENLTKVYGANTAVENLSFTIKRGKVYGFLGPNGAGKSTTMNIITGYLAPTSGTVSICGDDIIKEPAKAKKHIGYLPEIPPLYMDMTVEEYLFFVAELKAIKKEDRKEAVRKVMEETSVSDIKGRLIKNLSKGYKQRVGFAQAILGNPEIIILDEPTVGLDPKQIIEIRELIKKLGENHTVIFSSHILSEVSTVCDEILIIAKGKLVARGTEEELIKNLGEEKKIILEVRGSAGEALEIINKIVPQEKTRDVSFDSDKEGIPKFIISLDENEDCREELFFAFSDKKLPIISMSVKESTLEDVFLELTENVKEDGADVCNI